MILEFCYSPGQQTQHIIERSVAAVAFLAKQPIQYNAYRIHAINQLSASKLTRCAGRFTHDLSREE